MIQISKDCLRDRTSIAELRAHWKSLPNYEQQIQSVENLIAGAAPDDELWWYDWGPCTGLAIVRNGDIVGILELIHAHINRQQTFRWEGTAPDAHQLHALRKLVPWFRDLPLHEVLNYLRTRRMITLNYLLEEEIDVLTREGQAAGLTVELS